MDQSGAAMTARWLFIRSHRGTLKLRNLSFLLPAQTDNLLKDDIWSSHPARQELD
jgi:hypothetical protein